MNVMAVIYNNIIPFDINNSFKSYFYNICKLSNTIHLNMM